ncbi:TetR family transcriptional regulator [Amycolatopsis granulosa]|uniref:TetR family transcriptional regulator n=1 Tax=Amycolatopsis granulosa TaxID=185684 RepID=UPI001424773B|nr:AcrR family transcriptional regulator [Amycolatopsis granulosa]
MNHPRISKGLTRDQIVAAAVELTRRRGLEGWSLRAVSEQVGVYPGAVFHHLGGGRDVLVAAVVDDIAARILLVPTRGTGWREYVRRLGEMGWGVLHRCPGVAWHIARNAAAGHLPQPIGARLVTVLTEAGFGQRAEATALQVIRILCLFIAGLDQLPDADPRVLERLWAADLALFLAGLDAVAGTRAAAGEPGVTE